jgi:homoaconitase/3-isopropylmalate dehydratase large subunit
MTDTHRIAVSTRTLYRKLVDSHTVSTIVAHNVLLYVDLHTMNEYTSPRRSSDWKRKGVRCCDPAKTWRAVATTVSGTALDCGHLLPEERPDQIIAELQKFFRA